MSRLALAGVIALLCTFPNVAPAQTRVRKPEPLVDKVRRSIEDGVRFLRAQENNTGNWEKDAIAADSKYTTGETSLAMLALLNAGVPPSDPIIQRGLKYLRGKKLDHTYVVSLQTMVYALAGQSEDRERIQENVKWLENARVMTDKGELLGWTYGRGGRLAGADPSNTQYALLALHDAHQLGGAKVTKEIWGQVRDLYKRTQNRDGGWTYNSGESLLTMTTAGVCGLYIAASELNERREVFNPDGTATRCGNYEEDKELQAGLKWIGLAFTPDYRRAIYYSLYGLERAGRLSGQRFLGDHDWYREGCAFLVQAQNKEDGSWPVKGGPDGHPIVTTSFSLLFLSKGRTPILITKFAHGTGSDWNNDRYDIRNLTDFASKEMFKRTPLAWQVWDTKRTHIENDAELLDATSELVQSPILYISGHKAPDFSENEKKLLKEYVNNGGFIFADACCGKKEFADGFRAVIKELFEDGLVPLEDNHPIWKSWAPVNANTSPFKLEGLSQGCKTIVVLSPQDMSCLFEANQRETPKGQLAFRLGGNIIAYATGMEVPKPRLTPGEVTRVKEDPKQIPRGFLKVAQIRHGPDWQPAPKAMRNLMEHLRLKGGLDVSLQTEAIRLDDAGNLADFKFFYMHGRNKFRIPDDDAANLRASLQGGGLLLADACCGNKNFDRAFRDFMGQVFPDQKLERISLTDDLFSRELNGEAIKTVRCRVEGVGGAAEKEYKEMAPFLEGIKVDGHWVVIYSKYDLGCALEKHPSSDCLGHDHPSALRLAGAAVLYTLKR
jgi:hypothetical protein